MRILIVEDEKKTASFIRKALQVEGFAVDVCGNGEDGVDDEPRMGSKEDEK